MGEDGRGWEKNWVGAGSAGEELTGFFDSCGMERLIENCLAAKKHRALII